MDITASGTFWQTPALPHLGPAEQPHGISAHMQASPRNQRACLGSSSSHGEFPLASNPSIVLHVLSECCLDPHDLARLEATCSFFKQPANYSPDTSLSLCELAALDMCMKRAVFKPMTTEEQDVMKKQCGGSWKLVLRFLKLGEQCYRRENCQAIAGPGHSVVVTKSGTVYTFGSSNCGQLGHGSFEEEWRPRLLRSLQGVRIIQATAGVGRTMLVSDTGRVYAFGKDSFGDSEYGGAGSKNISTPQLVQSLDGIFVVQAAIGNFFTAVLSREGRVYTFSWGADARLGHQTESQDQKPHPLKGALEDVPVVQIAAGYCYLLALTCQRGGMAVYSVGCGLGGKLGHGGRVDEHWPRLIEHFQQLQFQPVAVAAGAWHAGVVGQDGRVCTWGWGRYGCLGHGNEDCEHVPKVVESLVGVKAVHIATGDYTTFVVSDTGDVYSFGCGESSSLGHLSTATEGQANRHANILSPELVSSLKQRNEHVLQISLTNSVTWNAHTFALCESGKLYAFGAGDKGQLGIELLNNESERGTPDIVEIDLR
ncbi:hypothetical protein O6H91_23G043800 [Diphasiastrum complanatum]|uniref:Uncharacterized protein n=8 Tax=Diphasiastrum complanatum TaxID=34168 RepID=A0ACC2AA43_DIPCM|nr:hypothetical protein O6H91_23G043000 [Diphasiastrum complanatum]KAJ7514422.1 hypothetical protein O6H91_23G043000 [Diphasiastrum complanatum]KAJ7514423.1 hypothetical protein O6H91_23G043000 [Diphasiastrum complanatum]KAJ7514424.1 hypothetical protein O6H91_23G043000 [Diphasiastrum complanatum]KAJ7514425.1 hypothetical protein O6H91_23G043000 [Diphasiastrum complanatum]